MTKRQDEILKLISENEAPETILKKLKMKP